MNILTDLYQVLKEQRRSEMTYEEALLIALEEVKNPHAQSYLHAIPLAEKTYGIKALGIQLMYCLSNMGGYRGENAREVKKAFKKKIKELDNG